LADYNELTSRVVRPGQVLRIPAQTPAAVLAPEVRETDHSVPTDPATVESVSAEKQGAQRPEGPAASADPSDYSTNAGGVTVQAAETLGQLARWAGISASRLAEINHLRPSEPLALGRRLNVELVGVDATGFEARRVEYHRALEAAYFSSHRIKGTEVHRLTAGETLWTLTRSGKIPVWLLRQYNPDVDFNAARPGKDINIPRVESVEPVSSESAGRESIR
jgi:membrane-bound lytic murein transglycosylase D